MATHTVAGDELGVRAVTLSANTVDTVNFANDYERVEVLPHGGLVTDPIYFTVDGSTPTVAGKKTYVVLPGLPLTVDVPGGGLTVVKLISAGAAVYSVTRA